MRYSDDIIQRVKDATDLVAVIGEYVPLKKAGASYKGLCPFHSEKSPSFMVSPARGSFHCFGCGKGGNVLTFVMEMEKLTFPESLRLLAEKAGVPLPKPREEERDHEEDRRRERMQELNAFAAKFFHERLLASEGQGARDYFKGRGFGKEEAVQFLIGWAPAGWDTLLKAAQKEGYTQEELLAAGLVVKNEEKQSVYDKFRNRLIFPVKNTYDKIIAFGGRALGDDPGPKYLNSPETLLFKKSECLYLLDEAREAVRREGFALVVEGYFDALALHRHGFKHSVATLGTALTSQHGRMLKRYASDVVLLYDADEAGQAAAARGTEPLLEAGLRVRVLKLPDAKDPDEYLVKHPAAELAERVKEAPDYFRWRSGALKRGLAGAPVEERLRAAGTLVPTILKVTDEAEVLAACAAVESELGLDPRTMVDLVNAARRRPGSAGRSPAPSGDGKPKAAAPPAEDAGARIEAEFLALLTEQDGGFVDWAVKELPPEAFHGEGHRKLFEGLASGELKAGDLAREESLSVAFLRVDREIPPRVREGKILELAQALKKGLFKRKMAELKGLQEEAKGSGDEEKALGLAQQMALLKRQHSIEVENP